MKNARLMCLSWILVVVAGVADAAAQPSEPVGPYVVDVHGVLARFKEDSALADALDVTVQNMPTRGLGLSGGVHVYPIRRRRFAVGIGGEILVARDSRTPDQEEGSTVEGLTVTTTLSAFTPQISLNFGKRDGWSYISGGIGLARLNAERDDMPFPEGASRTRAINYGGGARWFTGPHLAFSFDFRFYTIDAQEGSGLRPPFPRSKLTVISAGISLH